MQVRKSISRSQVDSRLLSQMQHGTLTFQPDVLPDLVSDHAVQPLVHRHLFPDLSPGSLVELVHSRRDRSGLVSGDSG